MPGAGGPGYTLLKDTLREGFALRETDLTSGQVPEDADLLFVVDPTALDEAQQFAVDQFLMQGGTVMVASSRFDVDLTGSQISAAPAQTGLEDWLDHHGVGVAEAMVMDPQNTPFPIPVPRRVGGFVVEEIQTLDYPYFPDVRADGLSARSGITANLGQITVNWTSPVVLDADKHAGLDVTRLIQSSPGAWTSESPDMQPDFEQYGDLGFPHGDDIGRKLLAVVVEGRFESAFAGERSPLLPAEDAGADAEAASAARAGADADTAASEDPVAGADAGVDEQPVVSAVVERSPASARLIVIGSDSFLSDTAISLASEATQSRYLKPLEFVQNAVEWSLEDRGLLALRGRGQFSRLLEPVGREQRVFLESLNYALAAAGLVLVYWLHRVLRRRRERTLLAMLKNGASRRVLA
jgi:ABC-2 type transport system permease protein